MPPDEEDPGEGVLILGGTWELAGGQGTWYPPVPTSEPGPHRGAPAEGTASCPEMHGLLDGATPTCFHGAGSVLGSAVVAKIRQNAGAREELCLPGLPDIHVRDSLASRGCRQALC